MSETISPPTTTMWAVDLGPLDSVPVGEGRAVIVGDRRIAVFRLRSGRVFATQAECPHRGGPLADGVIAGAAVVCPLHEMKFDLETGEPSPPLCDALRTYAVRVADDGRIYLDRPLTDRPMTG